MEKRKQIILVVLFVVCVLFLILATIAGKAIAADKENADTTTTTTTTIATTTTPAATTVATAKTTKTTKKAVAPTTAKAKKKAATTATTTAPTETTTTTTTTTASPYWDGPVLTPSNGRIEGPSGQETYYNLDMSGVLNIMYANGFSGDYWVREDGCKMFGQYIMVAADLSIRPRGSIVQTSLGWGIVCDTGTFTYSNPYQLDIATCW